LSNNDSVLLLDNNNENENILVIRDCYLKILEFISNNGNGCHLLILGKAGVGKSTFIFWLLFKIWYNANSENSNVILPSIVYVDRDGNKYWLTSTGCFTYNSNIDPKPDYYFSDSYDVTDKYIANILFVVASSENEAENGYKEFSKRLKEVSKGFTKYIPSMSLSELAIAYPNIKKKVRDFRYDGYFYYL